MKKITNIIFSIFILSSFIPFHLKNSALTNEFKDTQYDLSKKYKDILNNSKKIYTNTKQKEICFEKQNRKVPILMYHAFTVSKSLTDSNKMYITALKFEKDLKYLKSKGYTTIFAKDLNKNLPEKPVVITIDDGYYDNYTYAYPLLKKYNMKATIAITKSASSNKKWYLNWNLIHTMYESELIDIQHHSNDLHRLNGKMKNGLITGRGLLPYTNEDMNAYEQRLKDDYNILKNRIESELGYTPSVFVYPYGLYSDDTERILKSLGVKITLTTQTGTADLNNGLYKLNRYLVHEGIDLSTILP